MSTSVEMMPDLVTVERPEDLCTYGEECERVAIYRAKFQRTCNHPHLACIPHRTEVEGHIRKYPMTGWCCKKCNTLLGLFQGWEPV